MCGINGIAFSSRSGRTVSRTTLEAMRDVITHRGPDEEGIFIDEAVGLGYGSLRRVIRINKRYATYSSKKDFPVGQRVDVGRK